MACVLLLGFYHERANLHTNSISLWICKALEYTALDIVLAQSQAWFPNPSLVSVSVFPSEAPTRDVILHQTSGRIHNKNVSTHLIGSIGRGER